VIGNVTPRLVAISLVFEERLFRPSTVNVDTLRQQVGEEIDQSQRPTSRLHPDSTSIAHRFGIELDVL
jgi:hypothetical protein